MTRPRLVFFTGGTALRAASRQLARINPNSVHLVTTFDSGGSTASLRRTFAMPAVGDLRNRLLALADRDRVDGLLLNVCSYRIPEDIPEPEARERLLRLAAPGNAIWREIEPDSAFLAQRCLQFFLGIMPPEFRARGACLGNLLLAGAYLRHNRDFGPALALMGNLLQTRGIVLPIVNASLHLGARLQDGRLIVGQHLFKSLTSPVADLFLTVHESAARLPAEGSPIECRPELLPQAENYIRTGNVICYPMGSFYSSLVANLIPRGVGQCVAASPGFKVFIPNTGTDPESRTLSLPDQIRVILRHLRADAPEAANEQLLQYVLVDKLHGRYSSPWDRRMERELAGLNVRVLSRNIVRADDPQKHEPLPLVRALQEIAARRQS